MPNKQKLQEAAATATRTADNEDRELWAILRAAHEEVLDRVFAEDYELFDCEKKPDKGAPPIEKLDYLFFAFFCEGFLKGMSLLPGKPNA